MREEKGGRVRSGGRGRLGSMYATDGRVKSVGALSALGRGCWGACSIVTLVIASTLDLEPVFKPDPLAMTSVSDFLDSDVHKYLEGTSRDNMIGFIEGDQPSLLKVDEEHMKRHSLGRHFVKGQLMILDCEKLMERISVAELA
ncbi:hypothetical protein GQ43DRAFT_490501 [Delitschia confertaspora ATCC 74209]|uniref:Uncharacterized protein n=1 Tax=Delitschia confertaspora ATCC 74209 TaxID=1513339 RepID=A0A9P4MUD8_9PLEO|nr:hypothetical protein GQ43DRAFT_490501 [Delitschia confertaspora ATCC 74209]